MTDDHVKYRKRMPCHSHVLGTNGSNNMKDDLFSIVNYNHQQQPPPHKRTAHVRKRSECLICNICDGPAHGYNFDAITCESCKAFFRRNALKPNEVFKCRNNDSQCIITVSTRKRCKACRLDKCFRQGMRADWILTDEERMNKRRKIEENRCLRQLIYPDSPDTDEIEIIETNNEPYDSKDENDDDLIELSFTTPSTRSPESFLSSTILTKIQQIQKAYADSVRLISLSPEIPSYPQSLQITAASDMINFVANMHTTRLITYFKLVPEFSSLNEHDKLILIKHNTFSLAFIRSALNYDLLTDTYHEPNTDDCVFAGRDLIQCFSLYQYERSTHCVRNLVKASLNDRFLLEVLLIIMVFSKGASICAFTDDVEPVAQDILSIYQAQNVFIDLLWKYCENKFGFLKTIQIWLKLTVVSMDAHLQSFITRHEYIKVDSVVDQLSPLMKSVMLIN